MCSLFMKVSLIVLLNYFCFITAFNFEGFQFSPEFNQTELQQEALEKHNHYRMIHGVPPLKLSKELCSYAIKAAQEIAERKKLFYPSDLLSKGFGMNLAYLSPGMYTPNEYGKLVTDNWYNEIKKYDFNSPGSSSGTGHFTQVVWKSTTEFGIGAEWKDNTIYIAAVYNPKANILTKFASNVLPPK